MHKRSALFWAMTLAELALVVATVASFAWAQPADAGSDNAPALAAVQPDRA
jgi:hypothetical protein